MVSATSMLYACSKIHHRGWWLSATSTKKLELDEYKMRSELGEKVIETEHTIIEDRNELIKRLREQAKAELAADKE